MKIDALSIYMTFTTFIVELWKLHKLTFRQIATETDPSMIQGQISLDQAYEEEFSQVILPYNTKEYTIFEIQSSNLYKENKPCEKELYGDFD